MKTKVLFILLSVLFIMPMNAMPYKRHQHKVKTRIIHSNIKVTTRSPLFFDLTADEIDSNLIITFQSFLDEADITVIDKNGVTVAFESKASIHEGNIPAPEADFYTIKLTSPTIDVTGEITLEEI